LRADQPTERDGGADAAESGARDDDAFHRPIVARAGYLRNLIATEGPPARR
jgi:hypothetical protein